MEVLIFVLSVLVITAVCLHDLFSRKRRIRKIAKKMLDSLEQIYIDKHECRVVDASDFSHVDLEYYDQTATTLQNKGFLILGDIEDLTLSQVYPDWRTFTRVLLDENGTIVSSIYHLKPLSPSAKQKPRSHKVVDFDTEFTNGSFLITSNAKRGKCMSQSSQVMAMCLSSQISTTRLLKIHEKRVRTYHEQNPQTQALCFRSLEDVLNSGNHLMAIKSAYRKSIGGGYLKEEMERVCKGDPDDLDDLHAVGERVFREMQKLQKSEKTKRDNQKTISERSPQGH